MILASFLIIAVGAYLLGSLSTGYLLVRLFRHEDIRQSGSGNIGATNVLRANGKLWARPLSCSMCSRARQLSGSAASSAACFCPTVHCATSSRSPSCLPSSATCFPSGSASAEARASPPALALSWSPLPLPLWPPSPSSRWSSRFSRYVSLASILGAASFPIFACFLVHGDRPPFYIAVQFAVALLIIAKHHQNIRRLLAGTESRLGVRRSA
jgi:glycerol-3-phosphate acyltransferase PlsY